jgi:hypothetical protein
MAIMGKYCKAYPIGRFLEYREWSEKTENVRRETKIVEGKEVEGKRQLSDDDHLYLQENYVVTVGVFKDENIIFDDVTPEWRDFCTHTLNFKILELDHETTRGT